MGQTHHRIDLFYLLFNLDNNKLLLSPFTNVILYFAYYKELFWVLFYP